MIFDGIIGSAFEQSRDFGPFISNFFSRFVNNPIFVDRPITFLDVRI